MVNVCVCVCARLSLCVCVTSYFIANLLKIFSDALSERRNSIFRTFNFRTLPFGRAILPLLLCRSKSEPRWSGKLQCDGNHHHIGRTDRHAIPSWFELQRSVLDMLREAITVQISSKLKIPASFTTLRSPSKSIATFGSTWWLLFV